MTPEIINDLRSVLAYNPDTGLITYTQNVGFKIKKGHVCNYVTRDGYISIGRLFNGRKMKHQAHRVAWALHTNEAPPACLDHVNRDRLDNRWCNLRPATRAQNILNGKTRRDNSSGMRGVTYMKNCKRWCGRVQLHGVVQRAYFVTQNEAIAWVRSKRAELFQAYDPML